MSRAYFHERPRPELDLPKPAPHAFLDTSHTKTCILCGQRLAPSQREQAPRYGKSQIRCTDREACASRRRPGGAL